MQDSLVRSLGSTYINNFMKNFIKNIKLSHIIKNKHIHKYTSSAYSSIDYSYDTKDFLTKTENYENKIKDKQNL